MNISSTHSISLTDVLRLALPLKTEILGDKAYQNHNLQWIIVLTTWDQLDNQANSGDLVIMPQHLQQTITEPQLRIEMSSLARKSVAGLICFQPVGQKTILHADGLELPLLLVPPEYPVRQLHKDISALLIDRQSAINERALQLYRRLSEMSREDQGLAAMADIMCELTGKITVVQDKRMEIQAISWPAQIQKTEALLNWLETREELPAILRNRKAAAKARQSYWQQILPLENLGRFISPIISGDRARGYVSIIGPAGGLDMLDSLAAEYGASACALEMAKAKAVSEAKKELRGDFLEGLLAKKLSPHEIERLASRLDHDTSRAHAILALSWLGKSTPSLRHLETTINWLLDNRTRPALIHIYGEQHVCIFQSLRQNDDTDTVQSLSQSLIKQIQAEFPNEKFIGGMSGPAKSLNEWPDVFQEALQAMQLGNRLNFENRIVEFQSLGVYQLLTGLEGVTAVSQFTSQIIRPLAAYDEQHNGSLIKTVAAYFKHHGNISQTADSLYIHRNTLLYRMERIQELTGQNLQQADMRLALHLALKFWQLRP